MFNKFIITACIASCVAINVRAQGQPCATDHHHEHLLQKYPLLAEYERQFNEQLGSKLAAKTTAAGPDTATYDIPIVVHVVHDYGVEYLSDNDIYDAANEWALAFVKKNADTANVIAPFVKYIGNARMRLHLATIDPKGNPTKGVVRHFSYLTYNGDDDSKLEPWPNNKYINIWFTSSLGSSGAAAYAYYPSSAAFMPYYDGVISLASYLNNSKTIPHELGHVLNLAHVWGNNNNAAVACGNDGVDDTPPTKGHTPGCVPAAIYDTTCATGYMKTYTSMSGLADSVVDYPDTTNAQNIMDYTYCAHMFSKGQCVRMRTALTSPVAGRSNLITPANLAETGAMNPMPDLAPVADFTLNKATGAGLTTDVRTQFLTYTNEGSFVFRNTSWNDTISSVYWTFSNGASVPTSSSMTTVTNRFSVPGWVNVSLTANSNAGSTTFTSNTLAYAADTTPAGGVGYTQKFSTPGDISNWPMFNYYNNQFKWEYYYGAGRGDNNCIRYRSFDTTDKINGMAKGDRDDVYTPAFNLQGVIGNLYVNFYTSGAATPAGGTASRDSLQIDVSTSGGARWTKIAGFRGTELANNGSRSTMFIHGASSSWVSRSVSIPEIHRTGQTFFRLRYWPGNVGNNLYLDDFSIGALPSELQELSGNVGQFVLFPNPSENGTNLAFTAGNDASATYTIRDLAGKTLATEVLTVTPGSTNQVFISRSLVPSAGLYFVTLTTGGTSTTRKMVVQ